jgi:hypothetical protein
MPRGRKVQHVGCKMSGCTNPHLGHGFCRLHCDWFHKGKITGDGKILIVVRQKGGRLCKVSGCDKRYEGGGFCGYHRCRYRRGIIDCNGNEIRELKCKPCLEKCKVDGCTNKDDGRGFCSKHRYQYRHGIINENGCQIKPLYNGRPPADPRSQHKKGEDFVLARYFNGGPRCKCSVCGNEFEFYQMDGHHPDRSKKTMSPTKIISYAVWNRPELIKELDSLVWVCAHCHRVIEYGEDTPYAETNVLGKYIDVAMSAILSKKGNSCVDCGRHLGRRTASFHHRDPLQKIDAISQIAGKYKLDFVLVEADKCDLLCEPCHRKRHHQNRNLKGNIDARNILLEFSPIGKKTHDGKQGCKIEGCTKKHNTRGFCKRHLYWVASGIVDINGKKLRSAYKGGFGKAKYLRTLPPNMQPPAIPEANF